MTRLLARGVCDLRLQQRNGFYYAAAAATVFMLVLLVLLPAAYLDWLVPVVLFSNLIVNGLYFMAGLVLLEKAEMSLSAQAVTPLRPHEYLLGKIATLGVLSLVESAAIVLLAYGASVNWPVLIAGLLLQTALFSSIGFVFVARYDSINEFLFPSVVVVNLLALPVADFVDVWPSALWWLHPAQGPLTLIGGGFVELSGAETAGALAAGAAWAGGAFALGVGSFRRFVVAGARRR